MTRPASLLAAGATLATSTALLGAASAAAAPSFTPLMPLPERGQIAARNNVTVLTSTARDLKTAVWVGTGGNLPVAIPSITGVPDWAQPHIGTDAARKPVVIYPSCADTADVRTCDLKQYAVLTGKVTTVPGVNTSGAGETEGAIDRGAVVVARWTSKDDPVGAAFGGQGKATTTLVYRAARTPARVLTTKGGQQLALDRGRVLFVRDGDPTAGTCGRSQLQILRVSGGSAKTLAQHTCGMDIQAVTLPTFIGNQVMYGVRGLEGQTVHRISTTGARKETATSKVAFSQFAATARSGGKYTEGLWYSEREPGAADEWSLGLVIGLPFGGK